MPQEYYPRTSIARQCVRIRLTNSVTDRSKNFRLSEKDFDDSVLEKVYEVPAASEVVKFPSEKSEQIEANSSQIQCILKLQNLPDIVFSEKDLGKTSIQDLVDFQKEDSGSTADVIQLYLECRPVDEKDNMNENDENYHNSPTQTQQKVFEKGNLKNRSKFTVSPPLVSPSILKSPSSSHSASKRVSFGGGTIPVHLQAPSFGNGGT